MKNLKSLSEFSFENSDAVLDLKNNHYQFAVQVCGGDGCGDSTNTSDVLATNDVPQGDTCTTTWGENGQMLSHVHKDKPSLGMG